MCMCSCVCNMRTKTFVDKPIAEFVAGGVFVSDDFEAGWEEEGEGDKD